MVARRRRLAERRKALGYSQELLADRLAIDRTTVGRWERGETDPYPYIRTKLSRVLHVAADELDALLALEPDHALTSPEPAPAIVGRVLSEPDPTGEIDEMYRREPLRLPAPAARPDPTTDGPAPSPAKRSSTSTQAIHPGQPGTLRRRPMAWARTNRAHLSSGYFMACGVIVPSSRRLILVNAAENWALS